MTKPIRRNSVVMVTRPAPCCGSETFLGRIYEVDGIRPDGGCCKSCGRWIDAPCAAVKGGAVAVSTLVNLNVAWVPHAWSS